MPYLRPDSTIPLSYVEVDGLHIAQAVNNTGDKLPILMLHGWGVDLSMVWPLASKLNTLGYPVYVPDLPGFGESHPPPIAWSVFDYAQIILKYAEHHQLEQFYLFGHSFGGRLGLILGAEQGERIPKMVLANSAGLRQQIAPSSQLRLNVYKSLRDGLKIIGLTRLSDSLRSWYNARYGSADFQNTSGVMRETFVKVVNQDLTDYAKRVQPSTLLLWGDQDTDTPLSQGQQLEQIIPDAGLVIYEGAGHYAYLERLADATRVIAYFLTND